MLSVSQYTVNAVVQSSTVRMATAVSRGRTCVTGSLTVPTIPMSFPLTVRRNPAVTASSVVTTTSVLRRDIYATSMMTAAISPTNSRVVSMFVDSDTHGSLGGLKS